MTAPDTPISQQAASQAQNSIGAHGADMEKFFGGMMQGGGMPDITQVLGDMDRRFATQQQGMVNDLKSSGIPLQSSAMARIMGDQLGQANIGHNLGRGQMEIDQMNQAMQRQFQGAGGLAGMPSYYAQPSSIEAAMFGMRQPYDMARMQGLGNAYNNLYSQNYYQPERIEGPSGYEMYVDPFLGPILQGLGSAAGAAIMS